ncbi:SAM-dependent methyltransferase [Actinomadura syzygii]|uniref:SAM-dependent methyltransferase n=1 Tax=Actinomadura syzygii TaxID=1427538 RepID=A0A5D0TS20_9ACTN|nr:SAM-dependent methyltransferase [Actinomadura syzygii]TYC08647.1 SAM-dependent methyltransferase [Actinomadura syzygii]
MTRNPANRDNAGIDDTVPHSARIWNYWLGGKDNYPVDREAGDRYFRDYPHIVDLAKAQRLFLQRAVRHLAAGRGIGQFLDLGTGLPAVDNTHEVAQRAAPGARTVYVDNDPLVLVHARSLLTSAPEDLTDYIEADARDPDLIVRRAARTLDFQRPVAVMMLGILGHIPESGDARGLVDWWAHYLPDGSYIAICDGVELTCGRGAAQKTYNTSGAAPYVLREPAQIAELFTFTGLELVDPGPAGPGLVAPNHWRPEHPDVDCWGEAVEARAGVGRVHAPR